MALIFMEGFDASDVPIKWNGNSFSTSSVGGGRFGTGRFATVSFGTATKLLLQEVNQVFFGTAINIPSLSVPCGISVWGDNGATCHLLVQFTPTGILLIRGAPVFGGTTLATATVPILPNVWYYIEVSATIAAAGGIGQVNLDGQQVINFTGNTKNGGTLNSVDAVGIGTFTSNPSSAIFDDLYVADATGTTNNTFLGDVRVQTLFPTGAGSSTQFTPTGSVNNWSNVNDTPDNAATFNSSTVVGQRDTYGMADVLASTGQIFGIQNNIHAYKTDSGQANIKGAIKSGPTIAYDPIQRLPSTNVWYGKIYETDPNTTLAWIPANVNAVESGGEVA